MTKSIARHALEIATQITVAKMSNTQATADKSGGENVGEFFTSVFSAVVKTMELAVDE